jgi:hypothetical protein
LRLYRDKYQHEDFPSETVIFPDFKDFPWIVDKFVNEEAEVSIVVPMWKKRLWWTK